jgi:hypothetical protein
MKPAPYPARRAKTSAGTFRTLKHHAREIQRLGRRAIADIIEIGRRLQEAKALLGHGKFLTGVAAEFGWSERTAENFMRVYALHCKSAKFANLNLPLSAFYLLAAPSTPDLALEEVATRVGNGAGLSIAEVRASSPTAVAHRRSAIRSLSPSKSYGRFAIGMRKLLIDALPSCKTTIAAPWCSSCTTCAEND